MTPRLQVFRAIVTRDTPFRSWIPHPYQSHKNQPRGLPNKHLLHARSTCLPFPLYAFFAFAKILMQLPHSYGKNNLLWMPHFRCERQVCAFDTTHGSWGSLLTAEDTSCNHHLEAKWAWVWSMTRWETIWEPCALSSMMMGRTRNARNQKCTGRGCDFQNAQEGMSIYFFLHLPPNYYSQTHVCC